MLIACRFLDTKPLPESLNTQLRHLEKTPAIVESKYKHFIEEISLQMSSDVGQYIQTSMC